MKNRILETKNLTIKTSKKTVLENVSFSLDLGETLFLMGKIGSGKSLLAKSLLYLKKEYQLDITGEIVIDGKNITNLQAQQLRQIRRETIRMVFQDPKLSLSPHMSVKHHLLENSNSSIEELLHIVDRLHLNRKLLTCYPGELSGGEQQRIMIAIALLAKPKILILDEAFSNLDHNTKKLVRSLIEEEQSLLSFGIISISHNISEIKDFSQKVIYIDKGKLTLRSMKALAKNTTKKALIYTPNNKSSEAAITLKNVCHSYKDKPVLKEINLKVAKGKILGITGNSGSGKTTLAKIICGIIKPTRGLVITKSKAMLLFQQPSASINPHLNVYQVIREPSTIQKKEDRVRESIKMVDLEKKYLHICTRRLSLGEQKKVAIARLISTQPEIAICDEPFTSLDNHSKTTISNLFKSLKNRLGMTYVIISHDTNILEEISDDIMVI